MRPAATPRRSSAPYAAPVTVVAPRDTAADVTIATASLFLALVAVLHLAKPELDPWWRMISEYAIGTHGWLMIVAFLALSASCFAAFATLRPHVRTTGGKVGLGFLVATAVALAAAGVFVSDPITATKDQLTTHGNLHGLSAMVGIPGFPIAAMLISRSLVRAPGWRFRRRPLLAAAHLTWVSLALMVATIALTLPAAGGRFSPDVPAGLPNRLVVLSYVVWLVVVARQATRVRAS